MSAWTYGPLFYSVGYMVTIIVYFNAQTGQDFAHIWTPIQADCCVLLMCPISLWALYYFLIQEDVADPSCTFHVADLEPAISTRSSFRGTLY